ncbi:hypothetical protein A2955_03985 [Candidatus Woesebacteria bacterium RIFCSPLOWO2_01_FULL_37_19]|uniref:Glycosyltransferase subfamily 4-like N-terminal domain-containing protein n=1 Tax=Candidatus Woesebacteria bacterium RIFCSPLOWO2_01_FULL_37_19 TaxID=1802514 RepID=A0A1F8B7C2_9BACT|nr:MAG: hypothetical protein A2955_03985 [Candidatus Woesebacteria bacterium RIFCSPLOWO2_01_FULL_37_19]
MKILQLTSHFSPNVGGVETHLDNLVRALVARENSVFVLTYRPLITKAKWKMYESRKDLRILRIPWFSGFFYEFVKTPILEFLYLLPGLFLATPLILFLESPDVIHTHGLIAGFVGVFWGKLFGKKTISTTHSIYHFPKNGMYTKFAKWIFANSHHVLTLSKQSKSEIANLGIPSDKITIFTYWVDLEKFKEVNGAKLDHLEGGPGSHLAAKRKIRKSFVVLFVGRLIEEKGILVLLEASRKWSKNITLVIIGTGPLESRIKNLEFRIKNLKYLGKIENNKLPDYYSAADVTIVPSIHEEGFGRVILESLACGTPVIGSNRGAIPEAMDDSVGMLIDVTPENIKKSVEFFYKNPGRLVELSKNARKFAKNKYSSKNISAIINVYSSKD